MTIQSRPFPSTVAGKRLHAALLDHGAIEGWWLDDLLEIEQEAAAAAVEPITKHALFHRLPSEIQEYARSILATPSPEDDKEEE